MADENAPQSKSPLYPKALGSNGTSQSRPFVWLAVGGGTCGLLVLAMIALVAPNKLHVLNESVYPPGNRAAIMTDLVFPILGGIIFGSLLGSAFFVTRLKHSIALPWMIVSWGFACGASAVVLPTLIVCLSGWVTGARSTGNFSGSGNVPSTPLSFNAAENALGQAVFLVIFAAPLLVPVGFIVGTVLAIKKRARLRR